MRVVADTNTVVSAFLWGGPPKAVLDAARDGRISLHTTPALLVELEDVLSRDKFTARDPDDDHVLAAALGTQAQPIVTRDHDLLTLGTFDNILILPAAQALEHISAAP